MSERPCILCQSPIGPHDSAGHLGPHVQHRNPARCVDLLRLRAEQAEADLAIVATALYYGDQIDHGRPFPRCPECRQSLMYQPNDCETCRRLGAHITDASIAEHCRALGQGDE